MSLILKMMSNEDAPDDDTRKGFILKTGVIDVEFGDNPDGVPFAAVLFQGLPDRETFYLANSGNVYVMDERGKTIAAYSPSPIHGDSEDGLDDLDTQSDIIGALAAGIDEINRHCPPEEQLVLDRLQLECLAHYVMSDEHGLGLSK